VAIQEAIELFREQQKSTVKKSTLKSYAKFLDQFRDRFSASEILSVSAEQIGQFLEETTEGLSRSTRRLRYAQIKAFFTCVIQTRGLNAKNPCTAGFSVTPAPDMQGLGVDQRKPQPDQAEGVMRNRVYTAKRRRAARNLPCR
jgi:hypothetical protein